MRRHLWCFVRYTGVFFPLHIEMVALPVALGGLIGTFLGTPHLSTFPFVTLDCICACGLGVSGAPHATQQRMQLCLQ